MALSESRKRANEKNFEKFDDIKLRVDKGRREELHISAASEGKSLNQYMIDCIDEHEKNKKDGERI